MRKKNSSPPADRGVASAFAALGHPARLEILRHLSQREACCCKEVVARLDLAQSTVSQHLKVLVAAGLVDYRPDRPRSRYTVNRQALAGLDKAFSCLVRSCCGNQQ